DDRAEVSQLMAAGGPEVNRMGKLALQGSAQDVRDFLDRGQYVARARDQEILTVSQLAELARLAGAQTGGQVAVRNEQRGGTTVTTIAIATPPTGRQPARDVELSYAFKGGLFVLGLHDYVGRILDLPSTETLAQSARFRDAVSAAGGPRTAGVTYLDLAALRAAAEAQLAPDDRTRYEREYKPYLEPLDRLVSATVAEGNSFVSRSIFIVK
ncbi:MAG: ALF repeat-containing protein, partial [Actinomycetota bacterium]|nr:ALF repeat-containing protein [Actinomycetota bacterium]